MLNNEEKFELKGFSRRMFRVWKDSFFLNKPSCSCFNSKNYYANITAINIQKDYKLDPFIHASNFPIILLFIAHCSAT